MRVNPDLTGNILSALEKIQDEQSQALLELSSGKRVNTPSDDPAAAAAEVNNQSQTMQVDQYLQSVESLRGLLQTGDSALNNVVTALTKAVSIGTEGASDTSSSGNRQQIAQEVQGVLDQVIQLANTSFRGSFIFSGTATNTAPFSEAAGVITYNGNQGANQSTVSDGRPLQSNVPGDKLFQQAGSDVLGSLQELVQGLQANDTTAISTAVADVSSALTYITVQRVFYGNALSQLDEVETNLNEQTTNLKSQENSLVGADLASTATKLSQAQTAHDGVLAAAARILQNTLLDYLK